MARMGATGACLAAAIAALAGIAAVRAPVAAAGQSAASQCDAGSWIGGTTNLCHGALVYRDYVYDDYGADTGLPASNTCPTFGGGVQPTGDQRYPTGEEDTADLRKLQLSITGGRLVITFTLNALFDQASTVGAIAIDTDNDATTGGGAWPGVHVSSSGWDVAAVFRAGMSGVTVDTTANTVTGSIPVPAGSTWRLQAVMAQADGTVMNVAFRGTDEQGGWFENAQAAALQAGDISAFGFPVSVADMQTNATRLAAVEPGPHERIYKSAYTLGRGEGMTYQAIQGDDPRPVGAQYNFVGPYQPYGIYLPDKPGPHGLQAVLPGLCVGIAARVSDPSMETQFGEARNRVLIAPLGRGPSSWYAGPGERDVLDALDDAQQSYAVDPNQVFISGESMGGYGAFRIAELHPDRFAGAITWVGYTDCLNETPLAGDCPVLGANMDPVDYVRNLRWVPTGMLYSGADEAVHVPTAIAMQQAFAATGYPYVWWMHPAAEHDTYAVLADYRKEALYTATMTRQVNPARVTYRYDPAVDDPADGLVNNYAYWVSGITTSHSGFGDLDVTSQGCGGSLPVTSATTGEGTDPVPWVSLGAAVTGSTPLLATPRVSGTFSNVATVTIDVTATCLAKSAIQYDLTTDGPVTVVFSDGRRLVLVGAGNHVGELAS